MAPQKSGRGWDWSGEPPEFRERSGEVGRTPKSLVGFRRAPRKSGRGREGTPEVQKGSG